MTPKSNLKKKYPMIAEKMNFISIEGVSTFRVKHSLTTSEIFSGNTAYGKTWTGLVNMDWNRLVKHGLDSKASDY